jgi:hypothetical protein
MNDSLTFIAGLLSGGGIVAVVAKYFFDKRLASHTHELQEERDRTSKLQEKEFDALPEAWKRLNDAFDKIRGLAFRLDPGLDKMTDEQLDEFLSNSQPQLAESEKKELKAAQKKTKYYEARIVFHYLSDALKAYNGYETYVRTNGIFIESGLRQKFHDISKLMTAALAEQHQNMQEPNLLRWKWQNYAVLDKTGQTLMEALEREVHKRLSKPDSIP